MRRSLRLLPASLHIIFLIALLGAAAVSSSVPSISSDIRASVERNATHWIPWFDLGVEALSKSKPDVALRAFLLSARLSGHPAAWSNAGFALTKTPGGPHPIMLHYFAAAFRIAPDTAAAIFLAQAMIMLSMHQRALEFTTLFLTRNCGRRSFPQIFSQPRTCDMALRSLSRSASNCVWRSGKPKILLHSGAAVDARSDMFAPAVIQTIILSRRALRCSISTCSRLAAGSVLVFWFDMLQQTCTRWQTRQQDVMLFHRFVVLMNAATNPETFCRSFIGSCI